MPADQPKRAAPHVGLRVLLAEDNAVNQTVGTGLLRKLGHTVLVADDGKETLALLARQRFDLVLMDVQMPVMDGLTAARKIRENEKQTGSRIPIIAVTAHVMAEDRELCLAAGMDGYIPKPIDIRVLGETIETVLSTGKANESKNAAPEEGTAPGKGVEWDVAKTLAMFGGAEDMLREVVGEYLVSVPNEMAELRQAVKEGNAPALAMVANCLKGEAGYLAIPTLSNRVIRLEAAAKKGDLKEAAQLLAELEPDVCAVMASIQQVRVRMGEGSLIRELVAK